MSDIPSTLFSPRIENGILKWYEGDTFAFTLHLNLLDQDGEPVTIRPGQKVEVVFFDETRTMVYSFDFDRVNGNTIVIPFSDDITALFRRGHYTYRVYYDAGDRTTLTVAEAVVE